MSTVIAKSGICEPEDVIANRLDPWHGSWFHPYAFTHLVVDDNASDDQVLVVDVTFRLCRTSGVPIRAELTCPDRRTIVMPITEGEGQAASWRPTPRPLVLAPRVCRELWSPRRQSRTRIGRLSGRALAVATAAAGDPSHGPQALGGRPRIRRTPLRAAQRGESRLRPAGRALAISLNDGPRTVKVRSMARPT